MRKFLALATSQGNVWQGKILIQAADLAQAQDKFFAWLKTQEVYPHMWRLNLEIQEVKQTDYEVIN